MINVLICDDNETHLKYIQKLTLESIENVNTVLFNSGHDLIDYLEKEVRPADIIICDIELDNINGINLAKYVKELNPGIQIIFISAYIHYFEDVYSVDHVWFLPKPINHEKFHKAIHRAVTKSIENENKFVVVTNRNSVYKVNLNDIEYIESVLREIKIHTKDTVYTKYAKLDGFVKSLDSRFLICHKSFAVNMDKIIKLGKSSFILKSEVEVPISQLKYSFAKAKFIDYIGRIL